MMIMHYHGIYQQKTKHVLTYTMVCDNNNNTAAEFT